MFPIDTLPATYVEERAAADEAKRLARLQELAIKEQQQKAGAQQQPHSLAQAFAQRPALSRPNSSGILGGLFQGFVRGASVSPPQSQCSTPQPGLAKQINTAELERIIAEQKRDADICAMPSW